MKRRPGGALLQDQGEEDESLDDAVNEKDKGDAAADRGQDFLQAETAAKKKQRN